MFSSECKRWYKNSPMEEKPNNPTDSEQRYPLQGNTATASRRDN